MKATDYVIQNFPFVDSNRMGALVRLLHRVLAKLLINHDQGCKFWWLYDQLGE